MIFGGAFSAARMPRGPQRQRSLGSGFIIDATARSSPTIMSSKTPTRSSSNCPTIRSMKPKSSAAIQRPISRSSRSTRKPR